ncbi:MULTISPECIES: phage tail length tape measure family protein [unclassified Mesorhizobium]|uniref:phage tail length tape measure family protein n=1 Tax=unclassified Mesorhizobium TaxID=325217 RepID=UPI000FD76498|nr:MULTISPECIES: phage tail length tape measure family protein [unclassified Mesorhizobium]TGT76708.1 hypothetical protein EN809_003635 [Mesorhizobium sp. M2E.F.Ca.ET.166.01.1.1]TGW02820.1 hypothetical protein EN797_003635 [Mesorhizobium sp. M2E.F.Ca.ET.154.01.1.1]
MADFEIRSLRVSAQMDASQYEAGAQQKVASDKAMVASGQAAGQAVSETTTKISQAGDVLSRLSRQYVDGYAAAQRFNSALNQLSSGIERGKISAEQTGPILDGIYRKYGLMGDAAQFAARGQTELASAITRANAKLAEQRNLSPVNQNQGGLARFGAMNAASQFQDIAITAAMGQSPLTIALQQGTQLGQALQIEMGDQGAKGLIKGLGAAFTSLLSPVNLLAVGLTGVVAVAIEFGSKLFQPLKTIDELLKQQTETVKALGVAYGDVAAKAQGTFANNGQNAFGIGAGSTINGLRIDIARETRNSLSGILINRGTGASGNQFGPAEVVPTEFAQFSGAIEYLRKTAREGQPDLAGFRKMVEDRWALDPNNQALTDAAAKLKELTDKGADAERALKQLQIIQRELFNNVGPNGFLLSRGTTNTADMGNLAAFEAQQRIAQQRSLQSFNASVLSVNAKSPEERAAAARAEAAASYNDAESSAARAQRIDLAGRLALIEAEHSLKEAQDERKRSLDQTVASQQLNVDLVGKTTAEVEGLRMAAQLEAQVREEAAKNNVKADEAEIARIKEKAAEYGRLKAIEDARTQIKSQQDDLEMQRLEVSTVGENALARQRATEALKTEQEIRKLGIPLYGQEAEALRANTAALSDQAEAMAHATMQADLLFQRRQILRNSEDQQIASALRSAGLPEDLNSTEAQMMRYNMALQESKDTFKGFFTDMFSGLREGKSLWESFSAAAVNALSKIADKLIDRGLDGIFNSIFGGDQAGSSPGLLGQLLNFGNGANGSTQQAANSNNGGSFLGRVFGTGGQSVSTMQVQAATVFINGAGVGIPGGGLGDILSRLGSPSFTPDTTLSDILGYGASGPNTAATSSRLLSGLGSPLGVFAGSSLTGDIGRYAAAIRSIESGSAGYSALGPMLANGNQALGAYQIMASNLPSWSQSALGYQVTRSQFMNNPSIQDAIFSHQFGSYVSRYGNPQDAASAWFTGGPLSTGAGRADVLGTTGASYVAKFNDALSKLGGVTDHASSAVSSLGGASNSAVSGLSSFASSLSETWKNLGSFLAPGGGGSSSWFQGLSSMFGGASGAFGFMNSISPMATADILSGSWGLFANGAAFRHGNVVPFAKGDVFSRPTYFPMSGGRTGMLGEAGDEAIMPLRRGPDGKLGVAAQTQAKPANDQRPQIIHQTNNFLMPGNPATPASQNQIAAKSAKALERLQRTA